MCVNSLLDFIPSLTLYHVLSLIVVIKGKGIQFIVLYPPKRSHDLPPLVGTVHTETISIPGGYSRAAGSI